MSNRHRPLKTIEISYVMGCLCLGLVASKYLILNTLAEVLVAVILICITAIKTKHLGTSAIAIAALIVGLQRGSYLLNQLEYYRNNQKRLITLIGRSENNSVYTDHSQISFDIKNLRDSSSLSKNIPGRISIKGFGVPMVYRGDTVEVSGKLGKGFGSKQASMTFSSIKIIKSSSSIVDKSRSRFEAGLISTLPEPLASFGMGLLIGQRSTLPKNINDQLTVVGLSHIVAVSGYNLTIIIDVSRRLFRKRSKYQATIMSLLLILLFLMFAGVSASVVRAAAIGVLSLWAWYYGRVFKPLCIILLAAAFTSYNNPIYIWSDLGWYLSFLAFFGILIVAPLVTARIYKDSKPKLVSLILIDTLSAQLMTAPIIMFSFGRFSFIALIANLLTVPLVPLAMLLCLISGVVGVIAAPISGWIALPCRWLLTYMLDIVSALSRLPNASVQQYVNVTQMVLLYGIIFGIVIILWHKQTRSSGIITGINHLVAGEI